MDSSFAQIKLHRNMIQMQALYECHTIPTGLTVASRRGTLSEV